jgi:hypothetical protein
MEVVYDQKKITTSQFNYCFPSSSSALYFYQRLFVLHFKRCKIAHENSPPLPDLT